MMQPEKTLPKTYIDKMEQQLQNVGFIVKKSMLLDASRKYLTINREEISSGCETKIIIEFNVSGNTILDINCIEQEKVITYEKERKIF